MTVPLVSAAAVTASAASSGDDTAMSELAVAAVLCALMLAVGVARYRGWRKGGLLLVRRFFPGSDTQFFGLAWFGGGGLWVLGGEMLFPDGRPFAALRLLGAIPLIIALMSFFWMPRVLLPRWYLAWREAGRPEWEVKDRWQVRYDDALRQVREKRARR